MSAPSAVFLPLPPARGLITEAQVCICHSEVYKIRPGELKLEKERRCWEICGFMICL